MTTVRLRALRLMRLPYELGISHAEVKTPLLAESPGDWKLVVPLTASV